MAARPAPNLWRALGRFFSDERLRQLFARYATYVGSSPLATPATLMLIAHVELEGVWLVDGGMHRLATVMSELARELGVDLHLDTHVSEILVKHGKACGVRWKTAPRYPPTSVSMATPRPIARGPARCGSDARSQTPGSRRPRAVGPDMVHQR
ncbi:MAG: hypothetical protein CM15mP103_02800 [Gammaproteobacteria bacterium]|nr:MAG: hypothetical protein CM15mP103_02800 [Gammaproteobacteria bacterium]